MARGCRIEQDVVEWLSEFIPREQLGELIERRDLGRAGARELLAQLSRLRFRKDAAIGSDDALAILFRRLFGVDIEGRQTHNFSGLNNIPSLDSADGLLCQGEGAHDRLLEQGTRNEALGRALPAPDAPARTAFYLKR